MGCGCPACGGSQRLTTEKFIVKAQGVHGRDVYDYSKVNYIKGDSKVIIICKVHGEFLQVPFSHLSGNGCPKCGRLRTSEKERMSVEGFLARAKKVHHGRYDYSQIIFTNLKTGIDILCHKHGIFKQKPCDHISGNGCPRCGNELRGLKKAMTTENFLEKAKAIYGDRYDYSLAVFYKSCKKVKIICPAHGMFEATPNNHLRKMGNCPVCAEKTRADKRRLPLQVFLDRAFKVHGDKYDYSKVVYERQHKKVEIICPEHGSFMQTPGAHLSDRGCPLCQESRGERKVALFLKSHGIPYERQKKFEGCKNLRNLRFDFYIPTLNICIEYDGRQHLMPSEYYGGVPAFMALKKIDDIKNKFCKDNGISLIRIPYNKKVVPILESNLILPEH